MVADGPFDDAISIHALHEESDVRGFWRDQAYGPFQSTLSMRRATSPSQDSISDQREFQSTLSMRRATGRRTVRHVHVASISIHALHEESDIEPGSNEETNDISIHALHEESDTSQPHTRHETIYFNPRSP